MILTWEDTYCPSSGEVYDFVMRRHILSINWQAIWFWPETARTVHHLWSSIILTLEGTYSPSSQNHRAPQMIESTCLLRSKSHSSPDDGQYVSSQVKIVELHRWWTVRALYGEKARTLNHLRSSMILTWEGTYCPSSGELYEFDMRRHILSIAPQMMDSTCPLRSKSNSSPDDGQNVPSHVKII
jgi:hypothetical protein